ESMAGSGCINNVLTLPTVYYSFVATGFAQNITLNYASGNFNASVFDGCSGAELSCSGFSSGTSLVSGLTLGNTYILRIASTGTGNFTVCVSESSVQPVPNDDCAQAEPVAISAYGACTPTIGQLLGATNSGQANPGCLNPTLGIADVFYSFVANGERQIVTMSQDSTNQVYFLSAYDACGGTELLCKLIGPTFDALGMEYALTGLTQGNTYIVRVMCRPAEAGPFALCVMDPPPATQIACGGPVVNHSMPALNNANEQWGYHSNGTGTFSLTFNSGDIESSTWDVLTIHDGIDANAPVLYVNPASQTDLTGVSVTATGSDLFMTLTSDGSFAPTGLNWTVQCAYHPDLACNANPVVCGVTYPGLSTGLGNNLPASACPFNGPASTGGTEWFVYTAATDQQITLSTCGNADFDTRISVFAGPDCNTLSCLAMGDDSPGCSGGSTTVNFNATTGNSYWIAVSGSGAEEGSYDLSVSCAPVCTPPANDGCASAEALTNTLADGTGTPATYTNECATVDAPTSCSGTLPVQGVWFSFNSGPYDHALITLLDNGENALYTASSLDYALYTGTCAGLGASGSVACATDAAGANIVNVTPNTPYLLLVYNTGGSGVEGTFGLMVEHPAYNDAAITAILDPAPGLYCSSLMAPQVTLLNNGDIDLTSVQITYGLSGGASHIYNWTGNLIYGASTTITLPTVTAEYGLGQTLTVATSLPNGVADDIPANDSQGVALDVGGEAVVVKIKTDNDASQLTWVIYDEFFNPVAQGGPYAQANTVINEEHCLSTINGNCFMFQLTDGFGDGLCCGNGNGYWALRTPAGGLLLRDLFDDFVDGDASPTYTPAWAGYPFGHSVCLPPGPANIAPTECGIMNNNLLNKVYCNKVTGATKYQFEFSDPDAGYIRRIARNRNYIIFTEMQAVPLTPGVTYFARVRTDRDGPIASAHFGTGCEMGLGVPQVVPCTELIQAPTYGHSCDETRAFNTNNSFIYAHPVVGATEYQFRLINTQEGYDQTFIRNTYILQLKWNNNVAPMLVDGYTYNVQINVKVNGLESGFCPSDCDITIDNSGNRPEASLTQANFGDATLWPNPVRDGQVSLNIEGIRDADQQITVDIQDIYGKQVFAKEFG
ncbi:MAG: hypothetical protein KDC01_07765, partial [Flavobacteriales bacterium]|nr:hypothetical protein [Flavobacteriales bacterium]